MGKRMRMRRLIKPEVGKVVIFAAGHGTIYSPKYKDIANLEPKIEAARRGGADIIFLTLGSARRCVKEFEKTNDVAWMMKVDCATLNYHIPNQIIPIASVQDALRMGADGVYSFAGLTKENERETIEYIGKLGEECEKYGVPFLIEAEFPSSYTPGASPLEEYGVDYLKRIVRLCAELGADIIKTNWPGNQDLFAELIELTSLPTILAGGFKKSAREFLTTLDLAIKAGAVGCSVGRNIFQSEDPEAMTRAICMIVKEGKSVDEACNYLEEKGIEIE